MQIIAFLLYIILILPSIISLIHILCGCTLAAVARLCKTYKMLPVFKGGSTLHGDEEGTNNLCSLALHTSLTFDPMVGRDSASELFGSRVGILGYPCEGGEGQE